MKRKLIALIATAGVLALPACSSNPSKQEIGTVSGAVVGGIVGASITGGSTFGTVAGAAAGGYVGSVIGHDLQSKHGGH